MPEWIDKVAGLMAALALLGLEVAPIKFSPLTILGNFVGKLLGIERLQNDLNKLKNEVDNNELDRIRYEILQFSGSLRQGLNRTEVDYMHIEDIFRKYRAKGGNSFVVHEMEYIRECHDKGRIL